MLNKLSKSYAVHHSFSLERSSGLFAYGNLHHKRLASNFINLLSLTKTFWQNKDSFIIMLAAVFATGLTIAAPAADKVAQLPGFEPTKFDVYSGYLEVPGPFKQNTYVNQ